MDVFFFVLCLIMSTVTTTSTNPPVTIVCSRALLITMTVTMAPTSVGLATLGQHDVILPPQWIIRDTMRGLSGLATIPQYNNLSPRCLLRHMPLMPWDLLRWILSFQSWALLPIHYFVYWCFLWCLFSAFKFPCGCHAQGSTVRVCNATTLWSIPLADKCTTWWWSVVQASSALSGCSLHCFEWGEVHTTYSAVSKPFHLYGRTYSSGSLSESPNLSVFPTWQGGVLFSRLYSNQWHGQLWICGVH